MVQYNEQGNYHNQTTLRGTKALNIKNAVNANANLWKQKSLWSRMCPRPLSAPLEAMSTASAIT